MLMLLNRKELVSQQWGIHFCGCAPHLRGAFYMRGRARRLALWSGGTIR